MANSEPHPLDPDSKLSGEERVVFQVFDAEPGSGRYPWLTAARASTLVTSLHALGWEIRKRDPLLDAALARRGDPKVSHVAADSIGNMAERHRAVLQIAGTFADTFTYDELVYRYNRRRGESGWYSTGTKFVEDLPAMEPQSIRSRCAELRRAGWIEQAGRALSDAGRPCSTWRVIR